MRLPKLLRLALAILTGRLRDTSSSPVRLDALTARLVDDPGPAVRAPVSFAAGFSHRLFGPGTGPDEPMPELGARRLGVRAVLEPGETVPFTLAWRLEAGGHAPTRAVLGDATVALPPAG